MSAWQVNAREETPAGRQPDAPRGSTQLNPGVNKGVLDEAYKVGVLALFFVSVCGADLWRDASFC
jgi:hypothetical protein